MNLINPPYTLEFQVPKYIIWYYMHEIILYTILMVKRAVGVTLLLFGHSLLKSWFKFAYLICSSERSRIILLIKYVKS